MPLFIDAFYLKHSFLYKTLIKHENAREKLLSA
jgi:hypothetical protein